MSVDGIMTTQKLVEQILTEHPITRASDDLLFIYVVGRINPKFTLEPFSYVMSNLHEFKIPSYETVRRTRQRIQQNNADLRPTDDVENARKERQKAFHAYAVGKS